MIYKVVINKTIEKEFVRNLKNGLFKPEVRDLIEYWITEIEEFGYKEYVKSDLYLMLNDHPLKNKRQGQRAISLDQTGGRLIYEILKDAIIIKVIKITPDHDYS